ncbi:hypothetical protein A2892_05320 [Candidatus Woesebacteria bacterium RIFCSPLOWO2_01_FULL_39_10b]|uniref:Nudix hydrolase domain-containing protein n=1 Tax=Candidatus Woesebacteria bacterium RIFCSPLOWO2_01_FULL_39_10b TaxID=1802517 RepID=A0A1F8BA73_9BACT|nr:MAG: hypothetical protein A2892_05320 [Candidatus Woesebacteria bacterium RIFCSPLOWO2_01_FULL_39_10b]
MNIVLMSGACVVKDNKTLLLQQAKTARHPGKWGPPGGRVKDGESMIDAALREVKEETNLDIKIRGLVQAGIKLHSNGKVSVITLFYSVPLKQNDLKIDKTELSDCKWVDKKQIDQDQFKLRDPLLKKILIKALTQKPAPIDSFEIYP